MQDILFFFKKVFARCTSEHRRKMRYHYHIVHKGNMQQFIFNHYVNECRTYLYFHKGFCMVYFGTDKRKAVTLPHSAQRKHAFIGKIKNMSKKNKSPARKKIDLELLHQRLGHITTRSLLAGDTSNVW